MFINEGGSMDVEVELFTKRSDEVEMMSGMEDLMNFVCEHALVEGDYGTHFTINEVNTISFHSCLVHYNF